HTDFFGQPLGNVKEAYGAGRTLHGRPVQSASYFQLALLIEWTEAGELLFQLGLIRDAGHANVYLYPGFSGDHLAAGSAMDHTRIYGDAAEQVNEFCDLENLPRELDDGAVSFFEINT